MATGAVLRKGEGSQTYTYSSQPRVVQEGEKYRESDSRPSNIMYDRRIVRGNTYALHSLPASTQPNPLELQRQQESKRRVIARKRVGEHLRIRSPPPVHGRKHIDIQTELYLEEITDKVEETDVCTQTDAFLDRPPSPLFIPAKTGMDVATQIEDGDLFDFDLEVKPILEVLVGKTVEQALLEVMEEEELSSLREQQRIFEENRNAELVETQRLEEQERRSREEKERRMMQQRRALMKEKETAEKVSARAFAQSYLSDLVPAVFTRLSNGGFFYDPIEREIEAAFMPWLMNETEKIVNKQLIARQLLDVILRELVKKKLGLAEPATKATEESTSNQEGEEKKEAKVKEEGATVDALVEGEGKSEQVADEKPEIEDSASKSEEPATQESKPEEPKPEAEEPKPEDPNKEKPVTEEPKSEEPATEKSKPEEPKSEEPASQELKPEEGKPEEPTAQETKPEEPKPETETEEPKKEDPVTEEPKPEEPKPEEPKTEEPKPEDPVTEEPKPEEPKTEEPNKEDPVTEEPKPEEPSSKDQTPAQQDQAESNLEDKPQDNQ